MSEHPPEASGAAAYVNPPAADSAPDAVGGTGWMQDPDGSFGVALRSDLALGIDIGGTGMKTAVVDLRTGSLASPRVREKTPRPSTPEAVVGVAAALVAQLERDGHPTSDLPAGVGLPGVVKGGTLLTAANIDRSWVGAPASGIFERHLGRPVLLINDADAAGIAEMRFGAGAGEPGVVLMLTLGTGIGVALFVDGRLVPNLELGHIEFHGRDAETLVGGAARERRKLGWKRWAHEFSAYLARLDQYLWPDLVILGGGVSKESARFLPHLTVRGRVVIARLLNSAGIVGAALAAAGASGVTGVPGVAAADEPGAADSEETGFPAMPDTAPPAAASGEPAAG